MQVTREVINKKPHIITDAIYQDDSVGIDLTLLNTMNTKKITNNYCPRTTHMDYNDGYIINSKGVKISKEDYDILYKYYSVSILSISDTL